jgi:hypothetical protein
LNTGFGVWLDLALIADASEKQNLGTALSTRNVVFQDAPLHWETNNIGHCTSSGTKRAPSVSMKSNDFIRGSEG